MTLRRKLSLAAAAAATAGAAVAAAAPASAGNITEPVQVHCELAHYYANYDAHNDKFYGEQADSVPRGGTMNRRIENPFVGPRGVIVFHINQWYFTSRACLG